MSTHIGKEKDKGLPELPKSEILEKGGPRPVRFRCVFLFFVTVGSCV